MAATSGGCGDFGVSIGNVLGGASLLFTYYGVNFFLSGLHSYAGAGDSSAGVSILEKVPGWMWAYVVIQVVIVALPRSARRRRAAASPERFDVGMMYISRRIRFRDHRLHNPALSDERKPSYFRACNNPHGHGHDYDVEVVVAGIRRSEHGHVPEPERPEARPRTPRRRTGGPAQSRRRSPLHAREDLDHRESRDGDLERKSPRVSPRASFISSASANPTTTSWSTQDHERSRSDRRARGPRPDNS
jgi:hypothetical protein